MPNLLGPEVRIVAPKAMAITAIVVAMVGVMGRPIIKPMTWMPMSSRDI